MANCRDCDNMQLRNCRQSSSTKSGVTCYCTEYCRYEDPDSRACGRYFTPRNPKNRYYITTKMVEKLGLGKDSVVYQTIKNMRENTLEIDPYYDGLIDMYDIIGPVVAKKMDEDEEFGYENSVIALNEFILPTCKEYSAGNVENAVDIYTKMVDELMQVYGVTLESAILERKAMEEDNSIENYSLGRLNYWENNIDVYKEIFGVSRKRTLNI